MFFYFCFYQGRTEGFSKKTISLNSLTIMNGAKLTAADTVISSPTVNILLHESLRVMAGGSIQGKWINISAGDIEVEASGYHHRRKPRIWRGLRSWKSIRYDAISI